MAGGKPNFFQIFFPKGTGWGILFSLIIGISGCLFTYFLPKEQPWSIFFQVVVTVIVTVILANTINHYQIVTVDSAANKMLQKIDEKIRSINGTPTNLFQIFQLNNGIYFNLDHHKFFHLLIESYTENGKERRYFIPVTTYNKVVMEFLNIGYKLKTINGLLLPFWYAPKEKDDSFEKYINNCKENPHLFKRITYYQDYGGDNSWRDDTVRMIYKDLESSEKNDDFAVRWVFTLITNVPRLKILFGDEIIEFFDIKELINTNYLHYKAPSFIEAIKKKISCFENEFLMKRYEDTTISCKMTSIITDLFREEMKENKFVAKSIIDSKFDEIDFDVVTEVGYYYKERDGKEYDRFVMYLNGSNAGPSVEIQIIIPEDDDKRNLIDSIQHKLSELLIM